MAQSIRVLFPRVRHTSNPYMVMLRESLQNQADIEVIDFSWKAALSDSYDVFHVHWPEILVHGDTFSRRAVKEARFAILLSHMRWRGKALVRTRHNLGLPKDLTPTQRRLLRRGERQTAMWIVLNEATPVPQGSLSEIIPHGHYRDWFAAYHKPDPVEGRVAYFGLIRDYKAVDTLVESFVELSDEKKDLSLTVAGKPSRPELAHGLQQIAGGDPRITFTFRFLSDEEIVSSLGAAELVVLPYREMHNSGGVLAALSLDRPVLVPRNAVNEQLAAEVGEGWVFMFDGGLTTEALGQGLTAVRDRGNVEPPDLSAREWKDCGPQHEAAYRRALGALR